MSVYLNGRAVARPVRNGTPYNALHNGRKVWADPKDTITSVAVLNVDGKPAPTSLPIDGSATLAAQATYGDGHKGELLTTKGVSFATTTPDFVTIEGNKVTWKHGGTAVITATIDSVKSGPVNITCAYKPESVTVSSGGKPVTMLTLAKGAAVTIDVNVLPAEASQDVTVVSDHPDIVSVESGEGGYSVNAVKEGTATLTVASKTSPDVTALIPVTVVSNMLRYGPATGLDGDKATVNGDGTLTLSGAGVANSWRGLAWNQDTAKFTPGTRFTLSCDGLAENTEMLLRFNNGSGAGNIFTVPARGDYTPSGTVPATVNTIQLVIRRISGSTVGLTGTVKPMCNLGDTPIPWVRPDDTTASGGGNELIPWRYPALPGSNYGITFTADAGGVHAKGTATGWASCNARITLEAGDYELSATTPDTNMYASLIKTDETTSRLSTLTTNPQTATIPAGTYLMRVGVTAKLTVDATITPTLTRIK